MTGPSANSSAVDERPVASRQATLGLPPEALPRHVAVIMDGNGRWAQRQGKQRTCGHEAGAKVVRAIVTECAELGLDVLTLYSFSIENWSRPAAEIRFLMDLYVNYLIAQRDQLMDNDVRFVQIGRRRPLPRRVLDELDRTVRLTANNKGLTLALALNYGSRTEITDAARAIAADVKEGRLNVADVDERLFASYLYTADLPDPDLLIRTAGEMRVSNYLLWQISYAELFVSQVCWPDFTVASLHEALRAFARRRRKFGAIEDPLARP